MEVVFKLLPISSKNVSRFYSNCLLPTTCVYRCKLLVVGGGTGGCSICWRLCDKLKPGEIILLEPSDRHYYQPLFTLIAAGIKSPEESCRPLQKLLPSKIRWYQDCAVEFDPDHCIVKTRKGHEIHYHYMVVAMGLVNDYDRIKGFREALESPCSGVTTIYSPDFCQTTWEYLQIHRGGHAVFTYPKLGAKCAGAAQKIMYLAEDYWRKKGIRDLTSISYYTGATALFGIPKYRDALCKIARERCIAPNYNSDLIEITPDSAVFQVGDEQEDPDCTQKITVPYTLLHVTPPMCPPYSLRNNDALTDSSGFLHINPHTLQHFIYCNIFGLGDCTTTPNGKTAAAIAPQSYVVEKNLLAMMSGGKPIVKYDGYGSCPIITAYNRGILAEFKYGQQICETFPYDQSKESRFVYDLKTKVFPFLYWHRQIKGKWSGPSTLRKFINPTGR